MFVGLTISNLEPENLTSALHRPLLSSDEREVCLQTFVCFHNNLASF